MNKIKRSVIKTNWHRKMKERANIYSSEKCQFCKAPTTILNGVIHHLAYPPGVYEKDVEELIDNGICVWLCKKCHNEIHVSKTLEESKTHLKKGGYCKYCNKLVYGGWDRAKSIGLDYCICKKCFKTLKRKNEIPISITLEESKTNLKKSNYCKYCNKLAYGGWDRAKSIGLDYCICKKCFKSLKKKKEKEESGQISLF